MTFVEKFIELCQSKVVDSVEHIKKCHLIYNTIQNGFGSFYLYNFIVIQVLTILNTYRTICIWMTYDKSVLELAVTSFGTMISALSFVLNALALTLTLEDAYLNMLGLADIAKRDLGMISSPINCLHKSYFSDGEGSLSETSVEKSDR